MQTNNTVKTISIVFGDITACEINTMLQAASEDGNEIAGAILSKQRNRRFDLTISEAEYLRDSMWNDVDRIAQGVSESAARAFERAAEKLDSAIHAV